MNRSNNFAETQSVLSQHMRPRSVASTSRPSSLVAETASCSKRVLQHQFRTNRRCRLAYAQVSAQERAETVAEAQGTAENIKKRRAPGRQTYRPSSFQELVNDATASVRAAIEDGMTRLEVEFPALPGNIDGKYLA